MPPSKNEFMVFLSHSEKDAALTMRICETLDRLHIRTFVDEYYFKGATNKSTRTQELIARIPYFLVLLTQNGLQSQCVHQEIGYAVGVNKTPITILEIEPATRIRLATRGFVEFDDPILYDPTNPNKLMASLVNTLYDSFSREQKWTDTIRLTCKCGEDYDGDLNYANVLNHPGMQRILWSCPKCGNRLELGLPGFEMRFLRLP